MRLPRARQAPRHTDAPRPAPERLLPSPPSGRPRKTERPRRFPERDHPIKHHVAGPGANPRVADRSKAGRPRAQQPTSSEPCARAAGARSGSTRQPRTTRLTCGPCTSKDSSGSPLRHDRVPREAIVRIANRGRALFHRSRSPTTHRSDSAMGEDRSNSGTNAQPGRCSSQPRTARLPLTWHRGSASRGVRDRFHAARRITRATTRVSQRAASGQLKGWVGDALATSQHRLIEPPELAERDLAKGLALAVPAAARLHDASNENAHPRRFSGQAGRNDRQQCRCAELR